MRMKYFRGIGLWNFVIWISQGYRLFYYLSYESVSSVYLRGAWKLFGISHSTWSNPQLELTQYVWTGTWWNNPKKISHSKFYEKMAKSFACLIYTEPFLNKFSSFKSIWWALQQLHDLDILCFINFKSISFCSNSDKQEGTGVNLQVSKPILKKGLESKDQNFMQNSLFRWQHFKRAKSWVGVGGLSSTGPSNTSWVEYNYNFVARWATN